MGDIYFENEFLTITYDKELQLATAIWNGFLSSDEFREAINICLRFMDEHRPVRWLGDNRKLRAIRKADQDWFVEYAFPRLAASSVRRNATIVSEDLFNKMAVEQIIKRASNLGDMVVKEFDDKESAMQWLKQPVTALELDQ